MQGGKLKVTFMKKISGHYHQEVASFASVYDAAMFLAEQIAIQQPITIEYIPEIKGLPHHG